MRDNNGKLIVSLVVGSELLMFSLCFPIIFTHENEDENLKLFGVFKNKTLNGKFFSENSLRATANIFLLFLFRSILSGIQGNVDVDFFRMIQGWDCGGVLKEIMR